MLKLLPEKTYPVSFVTLKSTGQLENWKSNSAIFCLLAGVKFLCAVARTDMKLVYTGLERRPRVLMTMAPATTTPTPMRNFDID